MLFRSHVGGQGIDGRSGTLLELDTKSCAHCGTVIAILQHGHDQLALQNVDILRAAGVAAHVQHEYVAKFRCRKCRGNICRACAKYTAETGECDEVKRKVDRFLARCDAVCSR